VLVRASQIFKQNLYKMQRTLIQYFQFFINGGMLGVIAWALQQSIYMAFSSQSDLDYLVASVLAYAPLIILNFYI